ncbi:MAM and LDL-receptor class A domain-containing protein 2 [Exaiptasia diaphana]|nr:MAM and LDL-receptor class A domain-containing protein 2 [Exaiptasia diaphana]
MANDEYAIRINTLLFQLVGYYFMFNARAHSSYGTNAQVYKTITIPAKDNIYMRFYYFMYSDMSKSYGSMGTLLVTAGSTNIFSKTGNQGKGWKKTDIKLTMSGSKKFTFKANKDRDPYGDIAIDDLWVAEYYKANITNVTASATEVCLNENVNLECNTYNGFPEQDEYLFYKDDQLLARGNNALKTISVKSSIAGNHTYQCSPSTDILGQAPNDTIIITTHEKGEKEKRISKTSKRKKEKNVLSQAGLEQRCSL